MSEATEFNKQGRFFQLLIPADLSELSKARRLIEEIGRAGGLPDDRVFDGQVAVSEAVANAIEHAASEVELAAWLLSDRIIVEITNDGAFQPGLYKDDQHRRRGLGLPLMVSLADQVHVSRIAGNRTQVSLTFLLEARGDRDATPSGSAHGGGAQTTPASVGFDVREVEDRYRNLVDLSPDAVLVHSEGRYVFANPAAARVFGARSPGELMGKSVMERIHPDDRELMARRMSHVLAGAVAPPVEGRMLRLDGTPFFVESTGSRVEFDASLAIQVVIRDITERKVAERKLVESEERLRLALEAADLGTWDLDLTTDTAVRSLRHDQIWGYQELQPEWGLEIAMRHVLPEDRALIREAYARGLETGVVLHENRVVWPDGTIRWVSVEGRVGYDDEGRAARVVGVVADTTERKQAEAALAVLHEQTELDQRRLAAILEATPSAVVLVEADTGRFSYVNERALELYGIDYRGMDLEAHVKKVQALYPDGTPFPLEEMPISHSFHGEEIRNVEMSIRRGDGTDVPVSVSSGPIRGTDGRIIAAVVVFDDVSERRRTEETLRQSEAAARDSEARYRDLFDSLIEGFCTIEMIFDERNNPVDYRFLQINQVFEERTGLRDAQGKLMRELAPDHDEHWFQIYGKVALTGEHVRFQAPATALGRSYDVAAWRVGGPGSREVGILFNDITERKLAEAERERLLAEEQELSEELAAANEELQSQLEELVAQRGELETQSVELASAYEELHSQNDELATQAEELEAQTEELGAQNEEWRVAHEELSVLYAREQEGSRRREALNEVNQSLTSSLEPAEILGRALENGARALGAERAVLEVREGDGSGSAGPSSFTGRASRHAPLPARGLCGHRHAGVGRGPCHRGRKR